MSLDAELTQLAACQLFEKCLYENYGNTGGAQVVHYSNDEEVSFSSLAIQEHAMLIRKLALQLPRQAGGTPLKQGMKRNRSTHNWTRDVRVLEKLLLLGEAAGEVSCSWMSLTWTSQDSRYKLIKLSL